MENIKELIEKAYRNDEVIPCCSESHKIMRNSEGNGSLYIRLPGTSGKDYDAWHEVVSSDVDVQTGFKAVKVDIPVGMLKDYRNYSHTMHPTIIENMYEEMLAQV